MTNREFINQIENIDFADCVIHEDFLNMACIESQNNNPLCENKECAKCVSLWLDKDVGEILNYNFHKGEKENG